MSPSRLQPLPSKRATILRKGQGGISYQHAAHPSLAEALTVNGEEIHWWSTQLNREETQQLIRENSRGVDLIIPRGGEGLIHFVQEHASVPVIVSGRGNNFLYIDEDVDFEMAIRLVINGKKRISVCNAIDKVLIHKDLPQLSEKVNLLVEQLEAKGISVWGSSKIAAYSPAIRLENNANTLCEEYLAPKLYLALVRG